MLASACNLLLIYYVAERPSEGTDRWALRRAPLQSVPHHGRRRLEVVGTQALAQRTCCLLRRAFEVKRTDSRLKKRTSEGGGGWSNTVVGFALIFEEDMSL